MESEKSPKYVETDQKGLIRDTETQALISTDSIALINYRKKKEIFKKQQAKLDSINTIKKEIDELKDDVSDIKNLLQSLLLSQGNNKE